MVKVQEKTMNLNMVNSGGHYLQAVTQVFIINQKTQGDRHLYVLKPY